MPESTYQRLLRQADELNRIGLPLESVIINAREAWDLAIEIRERDLPEETHQQILERVRNKGKLLMLGSHEIEMLN